MTINELLAKKRQNKGISVRRLSDIIEQKYDYFVSKSTLSYIEQPNKSIDAQLLFILIDFYQMDIEKITKLFLNRKKNPQN